jgi:hypothetical protein
MIQISIALTTSYSFTTSTGPWPAILVPREPVIQLDDLLSPQQLSQKRRFALQVIEFPPFAIRPGSPSGEPLDFVIAE